MEEIKLQYEYTDYIFTVSENNYLDPFSGPGIVIQRVSDGIIVGCSNYGKFIGTTPDDKSHTERLYAAARFLTHMLHHSDELNVRSLSEIRPLDIYMYERFFCPENEVAYVGEFLYNLACGGLLLNVTPKDVFFTK